MTVIDSFTQPFDAQNTRQPSSSLDGKSQNCVVSNAMSLVYVAFMSCMSFIGWTAMALTSMGLLFHMSGLDLTTHGSSFKSPDPPGSLNCQCDLVAHSSLTMDPFAHGDTIPMIFYVLYDINHDISEPHEIFYRGMKVLHKIGKNIHDFIHDMAATHEAVLLNLLMLFGKEFAEIYFP